MPEDQELIAEILSGSQAAMEVLTRKYYKPIYAFVYRRVGNKEISYDLTQDIFIKVIQRIHTYSHKVEFKSWLFTIAVNHCRDYWRSASYKQAAKQTELHDTVKTEPQSVPYIFERKETREEIKAALNALPEYQREALLLKYFHQLKIKEIAAVTNASIPTVKSRLKQGLGKLANLLRKDEDNERSEKRSRDGL